MTLVVFVYAQSHTSQTSGTLSLGCRQSLSCYSYTAITAEDGCVPQIRQVFFIKIVKGAELRAQKKYEAFF